MFSFIALQQRHCQSGHLNVAFAIDVFMGHFQFIISVLEEGRETCILYKSFMGFSTVCELLICVLRHWCHTDFHGWQDIAQFEFCHTYLFSCINCWIILFSCKKKAFCYLGEYYFILFHLKDSSHLCDGFFFFF